MDHEVLKEMDKALEKNNTLENLTLLIYTLSWPEPKEFCRHVIFGIGHNTSLSEVDLNFLQGYWGCPRDGRLWCMSVTCVGFSV